ncbi:MAG: GNAT family N-acetyltransferase [Trueperaceae bacterium]|nr:GNAT family N-acetyltransferase [Trueperaceae bacterium]
MEIRHMQIRHMQIRHDDLTGEQIIGLLREHLDDMRAITPPESVHALDLTGLRVPEVTFWSVWEGDTLVGCGALKALDETAGEVKSMRTIEAYRGRGVGARVLEHILGEAARRGYVRLYLETGARAEFAPARALYEKYGFVYRGPFGDYTGDPNSVFMVEQIGGDADLA